MLNLPKWLTTLIPSYLSPRTNIILPRYFYIDQRVYGQEIKHLFSKYWIFVGLLNELPKDNSWMRKKIGIKEILIVRDNNEIYAHENVCPHKNIRLRDTKNGHGALVCRYHAWSFNCDGSLRNIPHQERSYLLTKRQLKDARLTNYKVETLGNFIFVNLAKNPLKIEDQFDEKIIKSLKLLSRRLDNNFKDLHEKRNFNWKLNFENLRDSLHPSVLHSKSLAKTVDFSDQYIQQKPLSKLLSRKNIKFASSFTVDGHKKNNNGNKINECISPSFSDGYYNWLLFPNFHMATPDGGRSYSVEVHNPLSPVENEISHYFIMNRIKQNTHECSEDTFLESRLQESRRVHEEDFWACEEVQKALSFTDKEQCIGAYEHYNMNIASIYRRIIKR